MDNLPDQVFAKILNLLPIKQVIRCSIVSKRWDAACRYIIRTRESLIIGKDVPGPGLEPLMVTHCESYRHYDDTKWEWGWVRERPSLLMDGITLADKSLVSAMMTTLSQMVELTRLSVGMDDVIPADISPFIRKLAEQLTMLEIDFSVSMIGADVFPHLTRLRCRLFDPNSSAAFPKLAELIVDVRDNEEKLPNMRLPSLKKLLIVSFIYDAELVREFILANAANLTVLQMSETPLRLDPAVVFPNLMKVHCWGVDDAGICPFPALKHLTVARPVTPDFLSSLPADQMLSLDIDLTRERKDVLCAISKMKNLKSLKLSDDAGDESFGPFSSVFDNMHHLEKVKLVACGCRDEHDDRMMATLASQNPMLSDINFHRFRLTEAALTSLAQLQHLTDICLYQTQSVTTAGVMTLLRGSSRNTIRKFSFDKENVDGGQVTREISLMCEERGTTFDVDHASCFFNNSFEYVIHN